MTESSVIPGSNLSNGDLLRKGIHLSGFAVPFICIHLFNSLYVSLSLLTATIIYTVFELARTRGVNVLVFSAITRRAAASNGGAHRFETSPIYFAAGITLALFIFPTSIACASITVLTLGDSFAAIFGKALGRTPLFFTRSKKLEGTICGFIIAFLGCTLFIDPTKAFLAAAVGMLAEVLPTHLDDNLVIPLTVGTVLTLFN